MSLWEKVEQSPIIFFFSTLAVGFAAGFAAYGGTLKFVGLLTLSSAEIEARVRQGVAEELADHTARVASIIQAQVREEVSKQMIIWDFTRPLYAALPKDIDFLVRNLRISLKAADSITVIGPGPSDQYRLFLSHVVKTADGNWTAFLNIDGRMGTMEMHALKHPITIRSGAYTERMNAGSYEFYAIVEDVDPDGTVYLALARRLVAPWIREALFANVTGSPVDIRGERPEPIVCRKPKE